MLPGQPGILVQAVIQPEARAARSQRRQVRHPAFRHQALAQRQLEPVEPDGEHAPAARFRRPSRRIERNDGPPQNCGREPSRDPRVRPRFLTAAAAAIVL